MNKVGALGFLFVLFVFVCVASSSSVVKHGATGDYMWEKCDVLPVLNETCIKVVVDPNNLTLIISLLINNKTYYSDQISATETCLGDSTLLELISDIPVLLPFKPIIDALIDALGLIPGDVFSICLDVLDLNITKTQATGCPQLNLTLMCWEGECLYKGVDKFGCFKIDF